MTEIAI